MKKLLSIILAVTMLSSLCVNSMACSVSNGSEGQEVTGPIISGPAPRMTTEGFDATLTGNKSLDKTIVLSGDYRFFIIEVHNTGKNAIRVDVNGTVYTVEASKVYYIHSTRAWDVGSYSVGFSSASTSGTMSGWATCKIATTQAEVAFPD